MVQSKAWMDSRTYQDWITCILVPFVIGQGLHVHNRASLLQDSCMVHLANENMMAVQAHGIQMDIIPAGYTLCLQVMDKGVNKPFKEYLHQESMSWLVAQPQNSSPSHAVVGQWIHTACEKVTVKSIVNTWVGIGIVQFVDC